MYAIESLISTWQGAAVVSRYDAPTGAWIFIALHDLTLGPASGGTRMKVYPSPAEGLHDALRLAEGMTWKWASIALPHGGGKAVIALARPLEGQERQGLLERYGRLVDDLGGCFSTGVDLGTTTDDMTIVGRTSRFIHGIGREGGGRVDAGPLTARGVFAGILAATEHTFGTGVHGRTVLVQGVGAVGAPLARLLVQAGAQVLVCDADSTRAESVAHALGASAVALDGALATSCDILSPCAIGGIFDEQTIPHLACRVVAGSANNQLATAEDAERLHQRGILYVPDYVINAGGALSFGLLSQGSSLDEVGRRLDALGEIVTEILVAAHERHESPLHAARRRAEAIVAAAAQRRGQARVSPA